ncbi:MAG TPA: thioredoxin [Phycisphaerales bacterium]|nr:thioredoxin [Phycisphaerales bacterium]
MRVLVVLALVVGVGVVLAIKHGQGRTAEPDEASAAAGGPASLPVAGQTTVDTDAASTDSPPASTDDVTESSAATTVSRSLPRLVDLGAGTCVACKMMEPVLEQLRTEYEGRLRVDYHDVWKEPDVARHYSIRVIPTQIFLDPSGQELFRHEGFFSKEDILAKWKEMGFDLSAGTAAVESP